jgi:hypothetical protein
MQTKLIHGFCMEEPECGGHEKTEEPGTGSSANLKFPSCGEIKRRFKSSSSARIPPSPGPGRTQPIVAENLICPEFLSM